MRFSQFQKNPIMVALDINEANVAVRLTEELASSVSCVKVGPRLVYRAGSDLIRKLAQRTLVFIDCKFHDIPSVVEAAVVAAYESGASFVTVHASNGPECLKRLAALEAKLNQERPFQILGVTVLTSFSQQNLPTPWAPQSIARLVTELVQDCEDAGLTGIVCSAAELPLLENKKLFCVVPGIRPIGSAANDQSRTITPAEAMSLGASALVIGRPIIEAPNPSKVAREILSSLEPRP